MPGPLAPKFSSGYISGEPKRQDRKQHHGLPLGNMTDAPKMPETMLAVRARGPNRLYLDPITPVPAVRPGYLLIRVLSVALNPTDNKRLAMFGESSPHTMGCDVAGRVVFCGEDLDQDYVPGDRVAGLCYGMKPGDPFSGAFGQYALLKGALSMRVPEHVSDAEAATIAVGINFSGQGTPSFVIFTA